jgi:hypothetical protein
MPTIHNPSQFKPEDYEIVEYFDNQPPRHLFVDSQTQAERDTETLLLELESMLGMEPTVIEPRPDKIAEWNAERDLLFPDGAYKCQHCGNGNVRYVVSALHKPTNRRVCFGDICVNRLQFANQQEFKAAALRRKGALQAAALRVWHQCKKYVMEHPEVATYARQMQEPVHANNLFVKDVFHRFWKYGSMSPAQLAAIGNSLQRDIDVAARRAAIAAEPPPSAPAPEGRVQVTGEVLSMRIDRTQFGCITKMLVKLASGSKVWCSVPTGANELRRGDTITFTATFERKAGDQFFAFGKRPRLHSVTSAQPAHA